MADLTNPAGPDNPGDGTPRPEVRLIPPDDQTMRVAQAPDALVTTGLSIRTLGRFALAHGDRPIAPGEWGRRKVRDVFLYLVTKSLFDPRLPIPREELIEVFWPDLTVRTGQSSLYAAISRLRRVLEPNLGGRRQSRFIVQDAGSYTLQLDDTDTCDAALFLRAARDALAHGHEHDLRDALRLYGGEYLPEDRYAEWTIPARERLTELRLATLEALSDDRARAGDWAAAMEHAQEALRVEPSRESAHRRLMAAYAGAGQRDRALRQYRLCRVELAQAVGAEPAPETIALYYELRELSGDAGDTDEYGAG